MKPTDELKNEHLIICRALSGLAQAAQSLENGRDVPPELLREELDFINNFAERCHIRKEESVLFPALEDQLVLKRLNPLTKMLSEHNKARKIIKSLNDAVERYAEGDRGQSSVIASLSRDYLSLLFKHIRNENLVLISMVEKNMRADKKLEVAERFDFIEEELGPRHSENYSRLADKLHQEGKDLAA